MLDYIREADGDLAQKIMDNMFTFDDLNKLDDKGIQALLKEVQSESLVLAPEGRHAGDAREGVQEHVHPRAETLREDLESRGPVRVSEVEAEQKELLKIVRRLMDEGQIVMASGSADEFSKRLEPAGAAAAQLAAGHLVHPVHPEGRAAGLLQLDARRLRRRPAGSGGRAPRRCCARRPPSRRPSGGRPRSMPRGRPATRTATATVSRPWRASKHSFAQQMSASSCRCCTASRASWPRWAAHRRRCGWWPRNWRAGGAQRDHHRPELVARVAQEAVHAVLMSARQIAVQVHLQDHALVSQEAAEALAARRRTAGGPGPHRSRRLPGRKRCRHHRCTHRGALERCGAAAGR